MRSLVWILLSLFLLSCGQAYHRSSSELSSLELASMPVQDPGITGPYQVKTFTPSTSSKGYQSAVVYYPSDSMATSFPATTLSGGFTNTKEQMSWLGMHLASFGIVTIVFTPTNPYALDGQVWANGHKASLTTLSAENLISSSPLYQRIDESRFGIMGFSYGGAGVVLAANQLGNKIRSAVPLCAYNPTTPTAQVATMFITGTDDTVASPSRVQTAFNRLSSSMPKAFVKFNKLVHGDIPNNGKLHDSIARFATAWQLVFLAGVSSYDTYLLGEEVQKQQSNPAVFAKATDYIYAN